MDRRPNSVRRRSILRRGTTAAALSTLAVALGVSLAPGPTTQFAAPEQLVAAKPTPWPVVEGAKFKDRIWTFEELDRQYQDQNLVRVQGNPDEPTVFSMASLNVLGSSWTAKRKQWASGPTRAAQAGRESKARGLTVVGLQEVQRDQVAPFAQASGMQVYPGNSSTPANSLAWDTKVWETVQTNLVKIPYYGRLQVPSPYVLLRYRQTGQLVWFANYHNASDMLGNASGKRIAATSIQARLLRDLTSDGLPMIHTGDMNERLPFFCRMFEAVGGNLTSADGAHHDGTCQAGQRVTWIDWIIGRNVEFSDYHMDMSFRTRRISDHPIVTATVRVPAASERAECKSHTRGDETAWWCPISGASGSPS